MSAPAHQLLDFSSEVHVLNSVLNRALAVVQSIRSRAYAVHRCWFKYRHTTQLLQQNVHPLRAQQRNFTVV
jgi:hypothetical protein